MDACSGWRCSTGARRWCATAICQQAEILTTVGPVAVQVPKVRDRSGAGVKFNSALAPPYVRRSARVAAALPWLYLKGISSGNLGEALEVLVAVGDGAKGLSPAALGRLKAEWSEQYQGWTRRSLAGKRYAYWWVDGIYTAGDGVASGAVPAPQCSGVGAGALCDHHRGGGAGLEVRV